MLLGVFTIVNAKKTSTTLWEGVYSDAVVITGTDLSSISAGNVLRVYCNAGNGSFYMAIKDNSSVLDYEATKLPSQDDMYLWIDASNTYRDITITSDDVTAFSGKGIYIKQNGSTTPTKVVLLTDDIDPTGTTSVWSGSHDLDNWSALALTDVTSKTNLAGIKMGDVIRVTYTSDADGTINFQNSSWVQYKNGVNPIKTTDSNATVEFDITSAALLEDIKANGIIVTGQNALLSKVELLTYSDSYLARSVTIGSDGIATWSSNDHVSFNGKGITVYYVSAASEGQVTLTPVTTSGKENTAWRYEGYIIKGPAGTYDIPVIEESAATYCSPNLLWASSDGTARVYKSHFTSYEFTNGDFWFNDADDKAAKIARIQNKYRYIFAKGGSGVGFYLVPVDFTSSTSEPFHLLGKNKAYLETDTNLAPSPGARIDLIFDDEETTGISTTLVNNEKIDNNYYDLMGRKVAQPTRGLYIVNGKKVIIK